MTAGASAATDQALPSTPAPRAVPAHRPRWTWAVVLVVALHLMTTSGGWAIVDHGEILYTARHLLHHASLELPPVPAMRGLPVISPGADGTVHTRFLPLPTLTLLPLLWLDEVLGWASEPAFGRLVHLQGHLLVAAALAVLGRAVLRTGASPQAAAAAVVLAGSAWGVWLVSRRVGPEPVMILMVCLFLLGEASLDHGVPSPTVRGRALVCALLPWTHVTGVVLALALVASAAARLSTAGPAPQAARRRDLRRIVVGAAVGAATMIVFWNGMYQHDWFSGGYGRYYAPGTAFGVRNPLVGAAEHVGMLALLYPVTLALAVAGTAAAPRGRALGTWVSASLTAAIIAIFCTFHAPEPARRLAVVACPLAAVAGSTWDRLRLRSPLPQALLAASGLCGLAWFFRVDGGWKAGPGGLNLPHYVLWSDLLAAGRPAWQYAGPLAVLVAIAGLAAARVWVLLRRPPAAAAVAP